MKVSIITVSYNSEKYINDCIISVKNQTYKNIEYIIIDGNSVDGTLNIIKSFDNIKYISESDNGIYDAMNKGISLASGDIIGILNSDDFFADKEVIARIVREFTNDFSLDAVYSDVLFVKEQDASTAVRYYSSKGFKAPLFKFGFQPAHPTFYVRKEIFKKYGLYKPEFKIAGDFELLLRFILVHKIKSKYIEDLWIIMRVGGASTSGIKSMLKINSEIIGACRANNIYTNKFMVYSKYLIKWWGFIRK